MLVLIMVTVALVMVVMLDVHRGKEIMLLFFGPAGHAGHAGHAALVVATDKAGRGV